MKPELTSLILAASLALSVFAIGCEHKPGPVGAGYTTLEQEETTVERRADEIDRELLEPSF